MARRWAVARGTCVYRGNRERERGRRGQSDKTGKPTLTM